MIQLSLPWKAFLKFFAISFIKLKQECSLLNLIHVPLSDLKPFYLLLIAQQVQIIVKYLYFYLSLYFMHMLFLRFQFSLCNFLKLVLLFLLKILLCWNDPPCYTQSCLPESFYMPFSKLFSLLADQSHNCLAKFIVTPSLEH